MYHVNEVANWFLSQTDFSKGDTMSPLKLQKLLYYAQAWHYTAFGEKLFEDKIEAWMNGPVVPSIYHRFSEVLKYNSIDSREIACPKFDERTELLLNEVYDEYGEHNGTYLERLTHSEKPWIDARGSLPGYAKCNNEITVESMRNYYSAKSHGKQSQE